MFYLIAQFNFSFRIQNDLGSVARINRQRGITLLELTVVIVILSVMLLFSVPSMRGFHEKNKLATSSRRLVSLIRYARAEAITREHETEIRIDTIKHRYRLDLNRYMYLQVSGSGDRDSLKWEQMEQIQSLPPYVTFKKVETEDDPYGREKITKLIFFPDGTVTGAVITLENRPPRKDAKSRSMTIEVPHATGLPEAYTATKENAASKKKEQTATEETDEKDLESFNQFFTEFEE